MFDRATESLIQGAPGLDGLDLENLPKEFTRIYASIVAARMRLRGLVGNSTQNAEPDEADTRRTAEALSEIEKEVRLLAELASVQEAFIALSPDRQDRQSAAFVAGTAHYVLAQAFRLLDVHTGHQRLEKNFIPSEVSATILFLIAGSSADAAEMANEISTVHHEQGSTRYQLLLDIQRFARGKLHGMAEPEGFNDFLEGDTNSEVATSALYHLIRKALYRFAKVMLGEEEPHVLQELFTQVEGLSAQVHGDQTFRSFSVFAGPQHLAALLRALSLDFPQGSLAKLIPPFGAGPTRWKQGLAHIAKKRPYLWPNHLNAISEGYLQAGHSAVISFPTGAGKSTLSELKILAALSADKDVVFLAPTLALVDQTAKALEAAFPEHQVERETTADDPFGFDSARLPPITVLTPEKCLSLMGFEPDLFNTVGLIVFDECHLLHAADPSRPQRAIDSMLCILNAVELAPRADFLMLSAMMSNAPEVAGWLQTILKKPCISLTMEWKPTRQVRGCLVYPTSEITELEVLIDQAKQVKTTKGPPVALQRKMRAHPQGFFGLRQSWTTKQRDDYALVPLLDHTVPLSLNQQWRPTPNANQVAAAIASAAVQAHRPVKTLIFCQTTVNANSAAEEARQTLGECAISLTKQESGNYSLALQEMGDPEALFVKVSADQRVTSSSLPHHSRLLPCERHLHESLFRREHGIHVLAATSTLAQGMNLPSQIVIIAGDSRFDEDDNRLSRLEAHELLNAAGRAGRAGENSYGLVLVIPSKVVHFGNAGNPTHDHWTGLQAIFSRSDQCLAIEDPLASILDAIHVESDDVSNAKEYFLRRLPVDPDGLDPDAPAKRLLARSFNGYLKNKAGELTWLPSRVSTALAARQTLSGDQELLDWADKLGAKFGVEPVIVRSLAKNFKNAPKGDTVEGWIDWLFTWLDGSPEYLPRLVRRDDLDSLFGKPYKQLENDEDRGKYAGGRLQGLLKLWMAGKTLKQIEIAFGTPPAKTGKCESARDFALRLVPDLAYVAFLPALILRECDHISIQSPNVEKLSACVREGVDTLEKLALGYLLKRSGARVSTHLKWNELDWLVSEAEPNEEWNDVYQRVKDVVTKYGS